ncbi:hypothetical protein HK096_007048, partial [Nowakowskiella sp. JEL0078]
MNPLIAHCVSTHGGLLESVSILASSNSWQVEICHGLFFGCGGLVGAFCMIMSNCDPSLFLDVADAWISKNTIPVGLTVHLHLK